MLIEFKMPELSKPEGDTQIEYTIGKILKKPGDTVAEGEVVLEVESVKADQEVESPCEGIIESIVVKKGQDGVFTGDLLFTVRVAAEQTVTPTENPPKPEQPTQTELHSPPEPSVARPTAPEPKSPLSITPLAQEMMDVLGLSPKEIEAPIGSLRIGSKMVLDVIKKRLSAPMPVSSPLTVHLPDFSTFGPVRREKMSGITKATAKNMQAAWSNVPHAWLMKKPT